MGAKSSKKRTNNAVNKTKVNEITTTINSKIIIEDVSIATTGYMSNNVDITEHTTKTKENGIEWFTALTGVARIQRELKYFIENAPSNLKLDSTFDESNIYKWIIKMKGAVGTIYEGETFKLQFIFNDSYPTDSPIITFVPSYVPKHPHIYSNGHICLEVLYEAYSKEMTIVYICNCINLMLDCNKKKARPFNDQSYSTGWAPSNPKMSSWMYEETY